MGCVHIGIDSIVSNGVGAQRKNDSIVSNGVGAESNLTEQYHMVLVHIVSTFFYISVN